MVPGAGINQVELIAALVVKHKVKHSLQGYQVFTELQSMVDVLLDVELEFLDPDFVELQVHLSQISVMMGDSLVPTVPQSWRSADAEVFVVASDIVGQSQHVIALDVEGLGQAEITVHDVVDVSVGSS